MRGMNKVVKVQRKRITIRRKVGNDKIENIIEGERIMTIENYNEEPMINPVPTLFWYINQFVQR